MRGTARPYRFAAEWRRLHDEEMAGTKLVCHVGRRVYVCRTDEAMGVLVESYDGSWSGAVLTHGDEYRCYWSTLYRHRDEMLCRPVAQDLAETALIGASLFGLESIGRGDCCP